MKKLPLVLVSLSTLAIAACGGGNGGPDARPYPDARPSIDAMGGADAAGNVDGGMDDAAADDASVADASADAMADASVADASPDAGPADASLPDADVRPDADSTVTPMVTSVDYTVAPHGGLLAVTGSGFVGATDVTIGGTSQPYILASDTLILINGVDAGTPLGTDDLLVIEGTAMSNAMSLQIIDLNVSPTVVALGSHPTISSTTFSFDSATLTVSLGGVSQTTGTINTTDFDIAGVAGVTAGMRPLAISSAGTDVAPMPIPVANMVINELDADQTGTDAGEFIEVATGLPNTAITGYVIVMWNGSNDLAYHTVPIDGTTDANGLLLGGNSGVTPTPVLAMQWPDNTLQNGADAASIHQGATTDFPNTTQVSALPAGTFLIDALVYDTNDADDAGLLGGLLGTGPEAVQINEDANNAKDTESISRCTPGRLDDRNFVVGAATPGAANTCP